MLHPLPNFLDNIKGEDQDIFFGRELETEILLSDIISVRLVVLFAKSGTGKNSLIMQAVRPRLEKLVIQTFYIRVGNQIHRIRHKCF